MLVRLNFPAQLSHMEFEEREALLRNGRPNTACRHPLTQPPITVLCVTIRHLVAEGRSTSLHLLHQSRVRAHRIFATVCVFDVLLVFLLWALVSQVERSIARGIVIGQHVADFVIGKRLIGRHDDRAR